MWPATVLPAMDGARVGVDVGGTFTDVVTVADGRLRVEKVATTPDAPDEGVLAGLDAVPVEPRRVAHVDHGTTVATNAVLEGDWATTALVTTEGFRDALEIGRQARPDVYDLRAEKPEPPVARHRRHEVPERLDERGEVLEPLDDDAVEAVADAVGDDIEAVAVSLLFAFENDDHERRIAETLRARLDVPVSRSSAVLPEMREYERTLATCLNAGLVPVLDAYLRRLESGLAETGVEAPLSVMQSGGGLASVDAARERPVTTVLSGPAAGVQGAAHVAGRAGHADLLTMDMGGTSCDVSLVEGGEPVVSTDVTVGDYPVGVPMVDVHTVGAGGGSVAWVDDGGALRVGPRSAGARPGPACYGRGGDEPTVTDAHVVLGRVDPAHLLGEEARPDRAREVLGELAGRLDSSPREAAAGVLDVADAAMARALRVVSVERGHDPRAFALVAFGGAGPLHATALARELDVPTVLVPRAAGVLSALGLLATDRTVDRSRSRVRAWAEVDVRELSATFREFAAEGRQRLGDAAVAERSVDLRYDGQTHDLAVPVPDDLDEAALSTVADRFHERHRRRFGHAAPDEPIELVTVRLRSRLAVEPPEPTPPSATGDLDDAVRTHRDVTVGGRPREVAVYDRAAIPADAALDGPAVIEGAESTALLRPGDAATVDADGTLVVEVGE